MTAAQSHDIDIDYDAATGEPLIAAMRLGARMTICLVGDMLLASLYYGTKPNPYDPNSALPVNVATARLTERAVHDVLEWAAPQWRWWGNKVGEGGIDQNWMHSATSATRGRKVVRDHAGIKVQHAALRRLQEWADANDVWRAGR